jgi:hypothetical protein
MRPTPFRTQIDAALTGAGFTPVELDERPYSNVRGSTNNVGYKRSIEGTRNEIVVVVQDDSARAYTVNPEPTRPTGYTAESDPARDAQGVLAAARWAWSVGREEDTGCQLLTHQSGHKQVCGAPFAERPGGGYICSYRCWMPRQRPSRRKTAGYF